MMTKCLLAPEQWSRRKPSMLLYIGFLQTLSVEACSHSGKLPACYRRGQGSIPFEKAHFLPPTTATSRGISDRKLGTAAPFLSVYVVHHRQSIHLDRVYIVARHRSPAPLVFFFIALSALANLSHTAHTSILYPAHYLPICHTTHSLHPDVSDMNRVHINCC